MWFTTATPYKKHREAKQANKMRSFYPRDGRNNDGQKLRMSKIEKDTFSFISSVLNVFLI